jgi:hypothetical protein
MNFRAQLINFVVPVILFALFCAIVMPHKER